MKKFLSSFMLVFLCLNNFFVYSEDNENDLREDFLYFIDSDKNNKIDLLEIVFNKEITGNFDKSKIKIYSNTGGLSSFKIDDYNLVNTIYSSGNSLFIKIFEQDLENIDLKINNTTSSHLRIRSNDGHGIVGVDGSVFGNFSYISSFLNYKNVGFKEIDDYRENLSGELVYNDLNINKDNINQNEEDQNQNIKDLEENNFDINEKENINGSGVILEKNDNLGNEVSKDFLEDDKLNQNENEKELNIEEQKVNQDENNSLKEDESIILEENSDILNEEGNIELQEIVQDENKKLEEIDSSADEESDIKKQEIILNENKEEQIDKNENIETDEQTQTGTLIDEDFSKTGEILQSDNVNLFPYQIKLIFQSPSYLLEKDTETQKYNCDRSKTDCKVNFSLNIDEGNGYKNIGTKYICEWDFGFDEYQEEINKCNPNTIVYPIGDFETKFKVIEKSSGKFFEKSFFVKNEGYLEPEPIIKTQTIINYVTQTTNTNTNSTIIPKPISKIKLQGIIGKEKTLIGNKLICYSESCSVNLDGRDSIASKNAVYFWDLGNGEEFIGLNPPSYQYGTGNYKITLKVDEGNSIFDETYFFVEVGKDKEIKETKKEEKLDIDNKNEVLQDKVFDQKYLSLKILRLLPNPFGSDHTEWIEIKNTGNEILNLNGCEIDDDLKTSSKPYKIDYDLLLKPGEKKRFYKFDTNISLKNTSGDEVNLICFGELIDTLKWNFDTPDNFIVDKFNSNIEDGKVFVKDIIDGDTFLIVFENGKEYILRHIGIDTPETKHPKKEVEKYGIEATNFAIKNLKGKYVEVIFDSKNIFDNYKRLLGFLKLGDKTYGELVLESGYAKVYDRIGFSLLELYKKIEQKAKNSRLGIWGSYEIDFSKVSLQEKNFDLKEKLKEIDVVFKKDELDVEVDVLGDLIKDLKLDDLKKEADNKNIQKQEKIQNIINTTFTQKISKQKRGVKIYGTTFPNTEIILKLQKIDNEDEFSFLNLFFKKSFANKETYYKVVSDNLGKYELLIKKISIGNFEIISFLKKGDTIFEIFKRNLLEIDNDYLEYLNYDLKIENTKKVEKIKQNLKSKITLQGKISKDNEIIGNKIICYNKDSCSVNFDGRESEGGKDVKYFWDFGDKTTFLGPNPNSKTFSKGVYIVSLKLSRQDEEDISYFIVDVRGKNSKITEEIKDEVKKNNSNNLTFIQNNLNKDIYFDKRLDKYYKDLFLSSLLFLLFLIFSFIILRRKDIL